MQSLTLTIVATPDGSVKVSGPIDNKFACYAMLESARDAIQNHNEQKAKSPIIGASAGALAGLRQD